MATRHGHNTLHNEVRLTVTSKITRETAYNAIQQRTQKYHISTDQQENTSIDHTVEERSKPPQQPKNAE
jgi:hypothetical protein